MKRTPVRRQGLDSARAGQNPNLLFFCRYACALVNQPRKRKLMSDTPQLTSITNENVEKLYDFLFAPWVKDMGLCEMTVGDGTAAAILPQNAALHFFRGAICGQAIMAAIDTVVVLAMSTQDRRTMGTTSQNTQFLRPATGDDLRIEANVLKFGSVVAFAEARVSLRSSGALVAHSTAEFIVERPPAGGARG